jgi:hypothetical protein
MAKMNLRDVTTREQLKLYYKDHNLVTIEEKIKHLKKKTGVLAIRGHFNDDSDILPCLEESALQGYWKALK